MGKLNNAVAVVTGASRGLGLGIARALGGEGATVYLTGRESGSTAGANALRGAAEAVSAAGGRGIAMFCDHGNDADVAKLFAEIANTSGHVDILVNNAAAVYQEELIMPGAFWDKPLRLADMITVGERSNYVASYYAAPLMLENRRGLIASISFYGAVSYFHGAAYGAAKAGTDKMARDMAVDLKPHDIASVSIWPGFILTEQLKAIPVAMLPPDLAANLPNFESPEFTGLVIAELYSDPERMAQSGKTLIGAELGMHYGISDTDGKQPPSYRDTMGSPNILFEEPV